MKKKFILVGSIIGICIIISVAALLLTDSAVVASPSQPLAECQTIQYSSENAINIVFFADQKTSEEYSNYLFQYPPFSETQDRFNVYFISPESYDPECEYYRGIALYCYNREVVRKAASCPNDHIVVLKSESRSIRSSAYRNVISVNTNVPKTVLLHELAHSISHKAEEYLAAGASIPREADNCVDSCEEFLGLNQDCEQECTTSSHYRSYDEGIMRTLYPSPVTYGEFNEITMEEDIIEQSGGTPDPGITGNAITDPSKAEEQRYKLLETKLENGKLEVVSKTTEIGYASGFGTGPNTIRIINEQGTLIAEEKTNAETLFITGQDNPEGEINTPPIEKPDTSFFISIPEESQADTVEINYNQESYTVSLEGTGAEACRL
jgi:hypothetical protein